MYSYDFHVLRILLHVIFRRTDHDRYLVIGRIFGSTLLISRFALVKFEFNKLGAGITTKTGPGSSTPPFLFHLLKQSGTDEKQ